MKQIKFSAADDLRTWIKQEAVRQGMSESSVIRMAIYEKQIRQAVGKENGDGHSV